MITKWRLVDKDEIILEGDEYSTQGTSADPNNNKQWKGEIDGRFMTYNPFGRTLRELNVLYEEGINRDPRRHADLCIWHIRRKIEST